MGKIKKIKQERKRAEVERQIKKAKQRRVFFWAAVWFFLFSISLAGGFFGYKAVDARYGLAGKIKQIVTSKKKVEEKVKRNYEKAPEMKIDVNKKYTAKFETSKGDFEIELYANKAPKTVNNFVTLSRDNFYDGLIFHRVIKDFMIQGGDPLGNGTGDPGYKFEDEINDVKLVQGVLAMANSGANTNGSQFFIVTKDKTEWLDGKHTAFGKVTSGLDVVMAIQNVETGENDKPKEDVVIKNIEISEK